ncbi:hypothetical protein BDZ89DRAFT_1162456 [Hymenopellis radicata]|nr:hypothetical protein BDZ89DRAFT_1162456 [Hymenopellis radicata]
MSSPSTEISTQPLLPCISDANLLYHARLLVDAWTSNANNANLFLTEDSRASVINRKLGRPVVAARGTIVYQYIRTATLDDNRRLTHAGRPLLCDREFAVALVALAASPSRTSILKDAEARYAGLPDGLVDDWYARVSELCVYLTLGIVPEGADEHILNKHLAVTVTKAPLPRDEKEGVPPLVSAGRKETKDGALTSSSLSTIDTSTDMKPTNEEDATLQATTNPSDPFLSLTVPSTKPHIIASDGDSAAEEAASEDSCSARAELVEDVQPKASSPAVPNNVQILVPESPAPSSVGVSSLPCDFLAENTSSIVSPLSPVISDDALSPAIPLCVDNTPETSVSRTSIATVDAASDQENKPLLGKRGRDTDVDGGETGLQEQVGYVNKRAHLSDSGDTI